MTTAVPHSYPWHRLRSPQYDEIFVSPHLDDAVYSCGGQIALLRARGQRVLLVTLFGNGKDDESGRGRFDNVLVRKREEHAAAQRLDVDYLWLNLPDVLYRKKTAADLVRYVLPFRFRNSPVQARVRAGVEAIAQRLLASGGRLHFPLGIGSHPDHREVHEVGRAMQAQNPRGVRFYEDVPYALVGALRDERLRQFGFAIVPTAMREDARAVHRFVFGREPRIVQRLGTAVVWSRLLWMRCLLRLDRRGERVAGDLCVEQLDVSDVIATKVAAIRAYASQSALFFPEDDAIYEVLPRQGARFVEHSWWLKKPEPEPAAPLDERAFERELARVDATLAAS